MLNIEANETHVLLPQVAKSSRAMPAIVWRSQVKPLPSVMRTPRRLHLVSTPPVDRFERQRRRRQLARDRVVESAYIAAALGTALVIWWSAR